MIEIDGSYGEGGGQILRTALSLSCLLGLSFHMYDIRRRRSPPGLKPQHLTAVHAARAVGNAHVTGAVQGSREIVFTPTVVKGGTYRFDVGTAGSTSLVLQTVLPPLLFAPEKSLLHLIGGTHVEFSPSYDYIDRVFIPMLGRVGCDVRVRMDAAGFYPRGGGKITAEIYPLQDLPRLMLTQREEIGIISGISAIANLPEHIAVRQVAAAREKLASFGWIMEVATARFPSPGKGSSILLAADAPPSLAGFEGLGAPGKPAESVGAEAAEKLLEWYRSGMALDRHLADQLVIYLALSGKTSMFTTEMITQHLVTNLWVTRRFHDFQYGIQGEVGGPGTVSFN